MKKIIWLLFCVMFFTGCTVEYNLTISNDTINENISISNKIDSSNELYYDKLSTNTYSQYNDDGIKKYTVKKMKKKENTIYNLSQKYSLKDFHQIRAISECFSASNLVKKSGEDNSYILQTNKGFKCMSYEYEKIDSYEINITFDDNYSIITHNATKVKGNKYTWQINSTNANNASISVEFKKNQNNETLTDKKIEKKSFNLFIIVIIVGIIIAIAIILILYALNLNKKRNKL